MLDQELPVSPKDISQMAEVAKDVLPQTVSETDGAIATIVGLFNNVVLYPIKKANLTFRYKLECFEEDLRNELKNVPTNKICAPKLMVVGPAIESLRYVYDEPELRDMYLKLLASSMNIDKTKKAHPSFVDIIKQMNPLDAILFQFISKKWDCGGRFPAINVDICFDDTGKCYANALPEWFMGWTIPGYSIFDTSESLIRLGRLGIIQLMFNQTAGEEGYDLLIRDPILLQILKSYEKANPERNHSFSVIKSTIYINEFGQQFASCCL